MRIWVFGLALAALFPASHAWACLELLSPASDARAFAEAEAVLRVEGLTEQYAAVPGTISQRVGVGTGRVVERLKGDQYSVGQTITYRITDGETDGAACPARRFVRPGQTYKLHLKHDPKGGPLLITYPTDAYASGGAR